MKSVTFENLKKQNYTMKESLRALKTNIQFCGDGYLQPVYPGCPTG